MAVSILGIGSVSALGSGVESLRALLSGRELPHPGQESVETPRGTVSLPVYRARLDGLDRFMQPRALRRLDQLSRMALLSAHLALEDAGLERPDPPRVGLVFGTGHGPQLTSFAFQDGLLDDANRFASPTLFVNSVHNSLASQVSIAMNIEGPCQTVTTFGQTVVVALDIARGWLDAGEVDLVLVGLGDEISPLLCYEVACQGEGHPGELRPLEFDRCSYSPGEGFICLALGARPEGSRYGSLERILSWRIGKESPPELAGIARDPVFLAAAGDRSEGRGYEALVGAGHEISGHAAWYGSMPVGLAFEVALAALTGSAVSCLACDAAGYGSLVTLSRGS
ncbi:MAG: beta-ketoacyl synthase N-terminal-like domain-containing protein [Planctomycetota bacterium]